LIFSWKSFFPSQRVISQVSLVSPTQLFFEGAFMVATIPNSSGPSLFSMFSGQDASVDRTKREAFLLSLLGQALVLALIVWSATSIAPGPGVDVRRISRDFRSMLPVTFSGSGGGGGGSRDPLQASHGTPPPASLQAQLAAPVVVLPKEPAKLMVEPTVIVAPEVPLPQGAQIGDPTSKVLSWLSNGQGGPGGIGDNGCCNGDGPGDGTGVGPGPGGIYIAGRNDVSVPRVTYNPEPSFSDEARKSKTQGMVLLVLVVGKDGHPYNIRVRNSLGMGLDEKAIEAVTTWRFLPATLRGQPVAAQIAVEVNFRLY
jgi:protein TonB